jgi:hypothetical protein
VIQTINVLARIWHATIDPRRQQKGRRLGGLNGFDLRRYLPPEVVARVGSHRC